MINLETTKRVHFIGIGGIGVSALARMMMAQGKKVAGSDLERSPITDALKEEGARVWIGHDPKHVRGSDLVVYTVAAKEDNPEVMAAIESGIPIISYPQMLGQLSRTYFTIAVSGSHGKTTTTAMIAKILRDAGLAPTVIVGSLLKDGGSNFIAGKGKYLVLEACEYHESFLNLAPDIAVITNIDNDHLDYYGSMANLRRAFKRFQNNVKSGGKVILGYKLQTTNYKLRVPGRHNQTNANTALAVAKALKIPEAKARKSLAKFSGTWRRIEYRGKTKAGALVYDDYGHHPTEIKATLAALREKYPKKKIVVVFQPHLYSRTKLLFNDFAKSFRDADEVLVTDIYPAREKFDPTITSEMLVVKIPHAHYFSDLKKLKNFLFRHAKRGDLILTLGAGDVYKVGEMVLQ